MCKQRAEAGLTLIILLLLSKPIVNNKQPREASRHLRNSQKNESRSCLCIHLLSAAAVRQLNAIPEEEDHE